MSPGAPDTLPDLTLVFGGDLAGTLERVDYPGPEFELKAWLYRPPGVGRGPLPALLFLHAGWRLIPDQQRHLKPFMDAGYVVMWPTYRGEHGNSGYHERFFGEVDDAAAAARWLAAHPAVDPERVYGLGWSAGGGIAALLSLWEDVPLRHTASSGGLYGPDNLHRQARSPRPDGIPAVPFDTTRPGEFAMRVLPANFHWMKRPHFAYLETQSEPWIGSIAAANQANLNGDTLIKVIMVAGDHFSVFPEVVRRYLRLIEEEGRN
jgi:acetyl esterase/lipase